MNEIAELKIGQGRDVRAGRGPASAISFALLAANLLGCGGPRALETPSGRVRMDACGDCPAPYVCFLNPLVEVRTLPGTKPGPTDVFWCSKPHDELEAAALDGSAPMPRRACTRAQQRYWIRAGKRFDCCVFERESSETREPKREVECYAE